MWEVPRGLREVREARKADGLGFDPLDARHQRHLKGSDWLSPWFSESELLMMERDVTVTYVVVDDVWRACFGTADSVAAAVASLPGLPGGWALAPMADGFAVAAHEGALQGGLRAN